MSSRRKGWRTLSRHLAPRSERRRRWRPHSERPRRRYAAVAAAWRASDTPAALAEPAAIVASALTPPKALSRVRKWAHRALTKAPRDDVDVSRRLPSSFARRRGRSLRIEKEVAAISPLQLVLAFTSRVAWTRRTHLGSRTRGLTFGRRRTPPSVFRSATPLARADPGGDRLVRNFGKRAAGGKTR